MFTFVGKPAGLGRPCNVEMVSLMRSDLVSPRLAGIFCSGRVIERSVPDLESKEARRVRLNSALTAFVLPTEESQQTSPGPVKDTTEGSTQYTYNESNGGLLQS